METVSASLQKKIFVPDNQPMAQALARTTHLGIGAHQDDLEFMALHGILECFGAPDRWFGAITCTDGAGSARTGIYADYDGEQMKQVRQVEQNTAAMVGRYGFMAQLGYASEAIKQRDAQAPIEDLTAILRATRPQVVYTHNPADKHLSHLGVFAATLKAIRNLPPPERPQKLIGCEIWRSLDWLDDTDKVLMDVSAHPNLAAALNGVYDSQIAGGKRYDLAVMGRRRANATFFQSHAVDKAQALSFGMDLTELIRNDSLAPMELVRARIRAFSASVDAALQNFF